MEMIKRIGIVIRHQAGNLIRLLRGRPVAPVPMGSMTLGKSDVELARKHLRASEPWDNQNTVTEFEAEFAKFCGAQDAFSFKAGRVALSAILHALDIGPDSEVIIPAYTCVVVPNAVNYVDSTPVYCDIELDTYGIDIDSLAQRITNKTKAIIVQHLFGLVCRDYEKILALAHDAGIAVIEDCAHSTGATFRGKSVGLYGDAGFFSCEQSKIFNSSCGGIAVSRRPDIMQKLQEYQEQSPWPDTRETAQALHTVILNYYRFRHAHRWLTADLISLIRGKFAYVSTSTEEIAGQKPNLYRARMSSPIASIALNQVRKINSYNQKRRINAANWNMWCVEHGYDVPMVIDDSQPVYLRYPVLVSEHFKQKPQLFLDQYGVLPGVWFVSHLHPSEELVENCPNATLAVKQCINLPCLLDHD